MAHRPTHVDKVLGITRSGSAAAMSRLAASWRRSMDRHGLDPGDAGKPDHVTETDLAQRRDRFDSFLRVAAPRLDRLFSLVGQSGCAVLLTDPEGVVLDQRVSGADADTFDAWGLAVGADWSEGREGTNGIGTCLAEQRRLIIHRDQHYMARNTGMSCIDAPIHGPEGELMGALDVSSARADQTEHINLLIGAQVAQTARGIEEAHFRAAFAGAGRRIVVTEGDEGDAAALLAIDGDDLVVGATREARRAFGLQTEGHLDPRPASDLLGRDSAPAGPTGLQKAERAAVVRALARSGGNVSQAARGLGIGRATLYRKMKALGIADS